MSETRSVKKDEVHEVWTTVENLRSEISGIKTDMASVGTSVRSIEQQVSKLTHDQKTPWGIIISAVMLMLALVTRGAVSP